MIDKNNFWGEKKGRIIEVSWFIVVLFLFFISLKFLRSGDLQLKVESFGVVAPFLVILLKMSTLIIAPLGGTPIYILAGAIFGTTKGFIVSFIGDILGSSVCFFLSRRYGQKVLSIFVGNQNLEKVLKTVNILTDTKSFIKARIGFVSMPELLAYASGLSKINFYIFTFVNSVFYIPMILFYVIFGSVIANLSLKYFLILPIFISLISLAGFFLLYKDYEKVEGM